MKPTLNQTIRKELYRLLEQEESSREMDNKRPAEGECMEETSAPMDSSMPKSGPMHLFEGCTEPLWPSTMPTPTGPRPMCSSNSCTNPLYPANPNGPYGCYNCGNTMWQAHVAFYQHVGSPNPGDVVHVNHTACSGSVTFCLRYVGYQQPAGTINMQILADVSSTPENSCKDCEDGGSGDDPCKLNPKECWFCELEDINTSDWVDPMALVNANGGCIQFGSTNTTYTSNYSGQMYTTQSDCTANSPCSEDGGDDKIQCQCCDGGYAQSMAQWVPATPGCSVLNGGGLYNCQPQQSTPISCGDDHERPGDAVELAEEIKRYKELL